MLNHCTIIYMLFYANVDELTILNDAISASDMAWWLLELPSGVVFFHPNKIRMLGYSDNDAKEFAHFTSFTDRIHKNDHEKVMRAMRDHLSGKNDRYEVSYRILTKDGTYRRFFDRGKVVARDNQNNTALAGIVIDITNNDPALAEALRIGQYNEHSEKPRPHSRP